MLENERYNQVLSAQKNLLSNSIISTSDPEEIELTGVDELAENHQLLIDEQYTTQRVFEKPFPDNFGQILLAETNLDSVRTTAVSLIGMPNAGKTTTANIIMKTRTYEIPELVGEAYKQEKKRLDDLDSFDFERLISNVLLIQEHEYSQAISNANISHNFGLNMEKLIIFDRLAWTDLPMIRAHFLAGNIAKEVLSEVEEIFLDKLRDPEKETNDVIISCLITPDTSLRRQSHGEKIGRIMNPHFLELLYEQYLRFHYEVAHFEETFGVKRPFTYCTVDMTGKSRFRELEKRINWSHIAQGGIYTIDSINKVVQQEF